ncbi:hypothetical protein L202_00602 [Cryptococcus amylolentus CBS 6039]|uniref:Glycosyltransferase family 18 catalytic domain-containing protein n=2 Tax=Cryptococcus amylolentus TaxID=104669 RepID=A0A1E3IAD5_9TREE|nr:hypothetical protein L202_00602 [Cryptococcus amylolentus CBS 6039]ODN84711.1 hypothetical protein L202_00602 [Cryptococcus amylolentus CBS 6039]ODO11545.1 hypothetical protein I350_00325 [Cryptococcus amylolentus CBS 6273]
MPQNGYTLLPTSSPSLGYTPPSGRPRLTRRNLTIALVTLTIGTSYFVGFSGHDERLNKMATWGNDNFGEWIPSSVLGNGETKECRGWDPSRPESEDPVGCLKARQYRQTQAVLQREIEHQHEHWYFAVDHNVDTFTKMSKCFLPVSDPDYTPCPEKPLVLSGWWYTATVLTETTTGEVVWQRSVLEQLEKLGYFWVGIGPYQNWIQAAEMMPDVYKTLWGSDMEVVSCATDPRCIAKEHYTPPEGAEDLSIGIPDEERGVIPLWALNVVDYWGARPKQISHNEYWWGITEKGDWSYQPLGQEWIATPWPLPGGHFHLPYTMEEQCMALPFTPLEERRDSALILAKRSAYFHYHHVSPPEFWTNLTRVDGIDLISTANIEEGMPMPDGLETIGMQSIDGYNELVGSVKAMIGVGVPTISPSVYASLCQGTPVIVPVFYDEQEPSEWRHYSGFSQHGPALRIGEPYVYSYNAKNYTELVEVVKRAMSTPIERFIPEDMRLDYTVSKLQEYLDRDLEGMMRVKVEENGGQVPALGKGLRERCHELKRCQPELAKGRVPSLPGRSL